MSGFTDKLAEYAGLDTKVPANVCIKCKQEFKQGVNVFTPEGRRETRISRLCEKCFDALMDDDED